MGLVCDKSFMKGLTQSVYLIGGFFSLGAGFFSDKFGRKKTLFFIILFTCIVYILCELAQLSIFNLGILSRYIIYTIGQLLIGCFQKSLYCVGFILLIEMTSLKHLTVISIYYLCMYVFGEFLILLIGYFARDWHMINWTIITYSIICIIILTIFVPESPRFLISKNRKNEAYKLLKKMSKFNRTKLNDSELESSLDKLIKTNNKTVKTKDMISNGSINLSMETLETKPNKFISLFTPVKSFLQTISFVYIWYTASLIYYGVSLGITDLDTLLSPYWIFFISSIAEIVGYLSCLLNDKFGRKKMFISYLILISLSCIIEAIFLALPKKTEILETSSNKLSSISKIVFAGITKAAASAVFDSCYVYNSLFYSTDIRTTAILFSANVGVIGSFLSPQIRFLGELFWAPFTFIFYTATALIAIGVLLGLSDPSKMQFN